MELPSCSDFKYEVIFIWVEVDNLSVAIEGWFLTFNLAHFDFLNELGLINVDIFVRRCKWQHRLLHGDLVIVRLNNLLGDHSNALDESLQVLHHIFLSSLLVSCSGGSRCCYYRNVIFELTLLFSSLYSFFGCPFCYLVRLFIIFYFRILVYFDNLSSSLDLGFYFTLLLIFLPEFLLRLESLHFFEHLVPDELEVTLVVYFVTRITGKDRQTIIAQ